MVGKQATGTRSAERERDAPRPDSMERWASYRDRYARGEWRAVIYRDMILADAAPLSRSRAPVMLDIGCGRGFDDDEPLQLSIAKHSAAYIGVEPDPKIQLAPVFTQTHRTILENAPITPESVDLAFCVMVLEHLDDPQPFWSKLHSVLRPGGIFWGFTVDGRHWFAPVSRLAARIGISTWYLDRKHGKALTDRHENYPTFYHSNTPRAIHRYARAFSSCEVISFSRVGQMEPYLPRILHAPSRLLDRLGQRFHLPGTGLAVRAVK